VPLLVAWLSSAFSGVLGWFAALLGKKAALGTAAIALYATITAALCAALATSISAVLSTSTLSSAVLQGMAMFMPTNLPACFSAIVVAEGLAAAFRWQRTNIQMYLSA